MNLRRLGQSDLQIAPIMLGGNVFGWSVDQAASSAILDAFVDAGFNAIDTANSYSRWVTGHKGGEDMGQGRGLTTSDIVREAEASLKRLQTDRVDLYQTHFDDPNTAPNETMQAYAQLIAQGKVRAVGTSNMSAARLRESLDASKQLGIPRYESLQPLYNLYDRKTFETDYEALCLNEKIGVITYYSLAAGFLTGKYRSLEDAGKSATRGGRVKQYLDARGLRILKALDDVAGRHAATPAQVSLAWLMARPGVTAPIVSATSLKQLAEVMQAVQLKLSGEDVQALDKASA